jgi:hypothetical protein
VIPDTTGPAMTIGAKSARMDAKGWVLVPITCPASEPGGCEGTLSLEALVQVRAGATREGSREGSVVARRARPSTRRLALGKTAFRVAGGAGLTVKLRLSRKHQRLVKTLRKLAVTGIVDAHDRTGNRRTTKKTLTLKAAAPAKR